MMQCACQDDGLARQRRARPGTPRPARHRANPKFPPPQTLSRTLDPDSGSWALLALGVASQDRNEGRRVIIRR